MSTRMPTKNKPNLGLVAIGIDSAVILFAILTGYSISKVTLPGGTSVEFEEKVPPSPTQGPPQEEPSMELPPTNYPDQPQQPIDNPYQPWFPGPTTYNQPAEIPSEQQSFDEVMQQTNDFIECLEAGTSQCSVYGP